MNHKVIQLAIMHLRDAWRDLLDDQSGGLYDRRMRRHDFIETANRLADILQSEYPDFDEHAFFRAIYG